MKKRISLIALLRLTMALLLLAEIIPVTAFAETGTMENSRIIQVVAGEGFSLGLRADGTVAFAGELSERSKAALASWHDISRIELYGWAYIVGYSDTEVPSLASTLVLDRMGYGITRVDWAGENFDTWTDVISVKIASNFIAGLRKDGTVLTKTGGISDRINLETLDTSGWRDIKSIHLYNDSCLIGLKNDGTAETTSDRQLNYFWHDGEASDQKTQWSDIEKIQTDYRGIFAFKKDGSFLGASFIDGSLPGGKPLTGPWDHLSELVIGSDSVFGLHQDGSVTAGYNPDDPRLIEVETWKNIRQLSLTGTSRFLPVGLCNDGTVRVINSYEGKPYGEWDVSSWKHVEKLFTGSEFTLGLRNDGTVLATGGEFGTLDGIADAGTWTEIVDIARSDSHILGLRKDGTVVALGKNDAGQCNVADWTVEKPAQAENDPEEGELASMPPFNDPADEVQLRQRATWFYETYLANPNKPGAGRNHFSAEEIMDIIRMINGEFVRDSEGMIRYEDKDVATVANDIYMIANCDSFVHYGARIIFTPTSPLFVDGTLAQQAARIIDRKMEKVVAAIRAEDDEAFITAAADWGSTVQDVFAYPDLGDNAVSIFQVKTPDSYFLYHCMCSKYSSTILEYSQLRHLDVKLLGIPDSQTEKQEEISLFQLMFNLNERASDTSALISGSEEEIEANNRTLPESLYMLAKEYFDSKYQLEIS